MLFLTFARKLKNYLEMEKPENSFLETRKTEEIATMSQNQFFEVFRSETFPIFLFSYFHFPISLRTIENDHFWISAFSMVVKSWKKWLFWKCSFSWCRVLGLLGKYFHIVWKYYVKVFPHYYYFKSISPYYCSGTPTYKILSLLFVNWMGYYYCTYLPLSGR